MHFSAPDYGLNLVKITNKTKLSYIFAEREKEWQQA